MSEDTEKPARLDAGLASYRGEMSVEDIFETMDKNQEAVADLFNSENGCCSEKLAEAVLAVEQNCSQLSNALKLGTLAMHHLSHGQARYDEAVDYLKRAATVAADLQRHAMAGLLSARVTETVRWATDADKEKSKERLH